MLRFLLLVVFKDLLYGKTDVSEVLLNAAGDVQISRDFSSMKIAFTIQNITDYVNLNSEILHKSIMNFGQLSPRAHMKLLNNECLDMIAYGTSITCGNSYKKDAEDCPKLKEDIWPNRLESYMNTFLSPCYRDGRPSEHRFIRVHCLCGIYEDDSLVCEVGAVQTHWLEGILINRMNAHSQSEIDFHAADIVFVEAQNDVDFPFVGLGSARHAPRETERFIQVVQRHKSKPSIIYLAASQTGENNRLGPFERFIGENYDQVSDQLPVAKHYSIPYISVIDAFPFVSDEIRQWWTDVFLTDSTVHPSRTGHKIDALLLLYYFKQVQLSLQNPISTSVDTYKYTEIETITPLHFTPQQLKEHVEELHHQPLTIVLTALVDWRGPFIDRNVVLESWSLKSLAELRPVSNNFGSNDYMSICSNKVGGEPFKLLFRADKLNFHFHKQHIRVVVGKAHTDMGSVQVQVHMNEKVVSETVIDCLLSAPKKESNGDVSRALAAKVEGDIAWYSEDIHVTSKLDIDAKSVMTISFTVVESDPKRERNTIQLTSVSLS